MGHNTVVEISGLRSSVQPVGPKVPVGRSLPNHYYYEILCLLGALALLLPQDDDCKCLRDCHVVEFNYPNVKPLHNSAYTNQLQLSRSAPDLTRREDGSC